MVVAAPDSSINKASASAKKSGENTNVEPLDEEKGVIYDAIPFIV